MGPKWTLVTNHGAVWILVAREGAITAQKIANRLGIAPRTAQRILAELEDEGYLTKHKEGRANRYEVCLERPMRHRGLVRLSVGEVLGAFLKSKQNGVPIADVSEEEEDREPALAGAPSSAANF